MLAKDMKTNTIWHGELWHSGKPMKRIENAKAIMYCMFRKKQKRKNTETVHWLFPHC